MKTDQNSNMQGTLDKRISMKKRRNAKRALLALNLVAVIFTTTVFSNPVSVLSEEVSTDAVQSIEDNAGGDAQIAEQADVQQNTAEAAQAAEAPSAENSAEAAKAEEPSDVNAPAENAMSAEMNAAEDEVVSTDVGASSASAVQSADASSASNGSFEDAGAGNTDGTKDGIIENDAEGLNEAEGTAANEEAEDATSQEQLTYADEHVKISASYTDGRAFTADSILTGTYLDSDEKNTVLSAVNAQISKDNSADTVSDTAENTESSGSAPIASTTVEYSVAGLHALMLAAKNQDGSDTTTEGDVTFSAEFKKGLNDAGYSTREENTENNEAAEDGSLTTTTTRCETLWKIYTVTEKNLTDITDITDAHNTHYEMDENGTLKSASFRGALPQTVAFVQIVKKTVTETTTQKETEKATERETESETDTETQKAKETEKITGTGTETEKTTEKTTEKVTEKTTERETDDVKEQISSSAAMPAVTFDQKVTTDNGTVMVHVEAEEGAFEEGTSMTVTPVTSQTILDKAIDAAGGKGAAAAMDITFTKPDGTKTEPLKPIHVKMISAVLNRADEAHVVHIADSGSTDVVARKSDGKTIESTSSEAASSDAKNAVSFESDSFSVYAIVYTVDYTYENSTYNMTGNTSMLLPDLMAKLGVADFDVSKVESVSFTNEDLVTVTKNDDGDYTLTSLQPFSSEEELTVVMSDGTVYKIAVTDDVDLSQYITGFSSYKGTTDQNGNTKWDKANTFNDGDSAKFTINYSIPKGTLKSGDSLTYDLGDHVTLPGNGESGDVKQGDTVVGTYSITKDGKITITLNDQFESTEAFTGDLTFEGTVHNDNTENSATVNFGAAGSVTINPKPKDTELTVAKRAEFDQGTGKIKYTIQAITHKGTNGPVRIEDWLTGLDFDSSQISGWSIKYNGSDKAPDGTTDLTKVTPTYGNNGWYVDLPEIPKTEYGNYTITYTLDPTNIKSDADGKEVINNTVRASDKSQQPTDTTETVYRKSFVKKSVSPDWTNRKLKWTITVVNNDPKNHNLTDDVFKDVLTVDGQKVTLPDTVTISDGGNTWTVIVGEDGKIDFPKWQFNTTYTITYETDMPDGPKNQTHDVKNTINYEHGGKTYSSSAEQTGIAGTQNIYDVDKSCEQTVDNYASNSYDVQWCSTITLPKGTVDKDKILYTDTLTTINKDDNATVTGQHYTTAKKLNEMSVWWYDGTTTGNLTKGTDYKILDAAGNDITNSTDETPLYGFKVEFTDTGIANLNGKKDVYIRYHSTATYGNQPENTTWVYHNTGAIPDHSKDVSTEHYKQQIIDKMSSATGPATVMSNGQRNYSDNGVSVDKDAGIIYYRVVVAIPQGTTGDIDLLDTIDPGLSYYKLSNVEIHGYGNDNYIYDDNEAASLNVTTGNPTQNSDGSTSVHFIVTGYTAGKNFVIYYQAKVEDDDFWNNSKNYKKDYSNSISWNTYTDGTKTTVEKERTILDKTAQQETVGSDKYASYNIVVNPSGRDLDPLHSTLDLADSISGGNDDTEYYLDVSSIKVYRYDEDNAPTYRGSEVSTSLYTYKYDTQSKKLTITIPDEFACVVAYRYHVDPGVNDATLNNTAQLTGVSNSSTSASTKIEASSSGANVYQYNMNIYKVDSDDYTLRLSGVTFELDKYDGKTYDQSQGKDVPIWTKVKDITTDANGHVTLNKDSDELSTNTCYRIIEKNLGTNSNYALDTSKVYYFVWKGAVNGNSNPSNNDVWGSIRDNGVLGDAVKNQTLFVTDSGTIYVPNKSTAVTVNKVWMDADKNEITNPGKTATVRLYRQTATPDGYKVTIHIHTGYDGYDPYTIYVKKNTNVTVK